jgi:hypothetical protein
VEEAVRDYLPIYTLHLPGEKMSFEFACKKKAETDKAIKVYDEDIGDLWIPLSQVEEMHFNPEGYGTIVVSDWIAKKSGLTED